MSEKDIIEINKKLDILVKLLLEKRQKENNVSEEDQTLFLASLNLTPAQMAPLLAKSANAVRILLTRLRKKGRLK
ncbi:MAG: hypothetical protein ABSG71_04225 [Thermodesulfobacteriota bacterium]|jgi:hypothetical protein